jgi:hypothetical protein
MGRAKINMELIRNEKSRMTTYNKRKKGLKKKAYEFATLCGVNVCMIIYGPKQKGQPGELAIWPENQEKIEEIINQYKAASTSSRKKETQSLSDYFIHRKKNIEKEISRMRMESFQAMCSTWVEGLNHLSDAQKRAFLGLLDAKIDEVQRKIDLLKRSNYIMKDEALERTGSSNFGSISSDFSYTTQGMPQRKVEPNTIINQQPMSCGKPLEIKLPMTWGERFNQFSDEQRVVLQGLLDNKIDEVQRKIDTLKGGNYMMKDATLGMTGSSNFGSIPSDFNFSYTQGMLQRNVETRTINQQPISYVKAMDSQFPTCYSSDQGLFPMLPFDINPMANPMEVKAEGCTQFGGMSSSGLQYTPPNNLICYDPTVGLMDNVMVNNSRVPSMHYYRPTMQQMMAYGQYPMMQSVSSQMQGPPADEFYNINDFQMKTKIERL